MSGKHHDDVQQPGEYHSFQQPAHADVIKEISGRVPDDEEHD